MTRTPTITSPTRTGTARSDLDPDGKIFIHGELWDATAEGAGDVVAEPAHSGPILAGRPGYPVRP